MMQKQTKTVPLITSSKQFSSQQNTMRGDTKTRLDDLKLVSIDCKKDVRHVSACFHYGKVKANHLSMAIAILRKWRHLEPESAQ